MGVKLSTLASSTLGSSLPITANMVTVADGERFPDVSSTASTVATAQRTGLDYFHCLIEYAETADFVGTRADFEEGSANRNSLEIVRVYARVTHSFSLLRGELITDPGLASHRYVQRLNWAQVDGYDIVISHVLLAEDMAILENVLRGDYTVDQDASLGTRGSRVDHVYANNLTSFFGTVNILRASDRLDIGYAAQPASGRSGFRVVSSPQSDQPNDIIVPPASELEDLTEQQRTIALGKDVAGNSVPGVFSVVPADELANYPLYGGAQGNVIHLVEFGVSSVQAGKLYAARAAEFDNLRTGDTYRIRATVNGAVEDITLVEAEVVRLFDGSAILTFSRVDRASNLPAVSTAQQFLDLLATHTPVLPTWQPANALVGPQLYVPEDTYRDNRNAIVNPAEGTDYVAEGYTEGSTWFNRITGEGWRFNSDDAWTRIGFNMVSEQIFGLSHGAGVTLTLTGGHRFSEYRAILALGEDYPHMIPTDLFITGRRFGIFRADAWFVSIQYASDTTFRLFRGGPAPLGGIWGLN